jgi:hypothetical protein
MAAGSWGGTGMSGDRPSAPDAYTRIVLGFATPTVLAADQTGVKLTPVENGPNIVRLDQNMPKFQYFLLEDRQRIGYDQSVPGAGLLIYHVDENMPNEDDPDHYLVDLEQSDGRRDLNRRAQARGDGTDPYPTTYNNAFTPVTTPNSLGYGASFSSIWIKNIARAASSTVSFDVEIIPPAVDGTACQEGSTCASGHCVDGVCCESACVGTCKACTVAKGSSADGTCTGLSDLPCNDGTSCTDGDVCEEGVCRGKVRTCPETECQREAACEPRVGACVPLPKADGISCNDTNPCTVHDSCHTGVCTGEKIACPVAECQQSAACDPRSGACVGVPVPDGTACSRGACSSGECLNRCGCSSIEGSAVPLAALASLLVGLRRRGQRGRH